MIFVLKTIKSNSTAYPEVLSESMIMDREFVDGVKRLRIACKDEARRVPSSSALRHSLQL